MRHFSIVAAMDSNRVIGLNNQLPWHFPADLAHFKFATMDKPILMGRKTFESIGKPLPGRRNIVISHNQALQIPGCEVVHSLEQGLILAHDNKEVMLIGGAQLFQQALPLVDRLYLTFIHHAFTGDTYFPQWNPKEWEEMSREEHLPDNKNIYPFTFVILERTRKN